jgi:predicted Zn-dependent protease
VKYTPKELTDNVNVPHVHPLRELFVLLGGVLLVLLIGYLILGLIVDVVAAHLSPATEQKINQRLAPLYAKLFTNTAPDRVAANRELQGLMEKVQRASGLTQLTCRVVIVESADINALALPGGQMVVFSGLLAAVESENELAMVLAHELGHFAHRDHLRGLGRGLVLLTMSTVLLGGDDTVSRFLQNSLTSTELKFSRQQELAADDWGLHAVVKQYGHAGGCADFFRRLNRREKLPRWFAAFGTHPNAESRVRRLEEKIAKEKYRLDAPQPLPAGLKANEA